MAHFEGITLPDELYYQPDDHLWVRLDGARAWVGLDDMAQRSAGAISAVRLKPAGRPIAKGKPFGTMEAGKYVGPLKAPISGKVIEINPDVMSQPGLINQDSYGKAWLLLMEPEDAARDLAELIHGGNLQAWLTRSVTDWRQRGLLKG
jgi:glycine cleavage system H protein